MATGPSARHTRAFLRTRSCAARADDTITRRGIPHSTLSHATRYPAQRGIPRDTACSEQLVARADALARENAKLRLREGRYEAAPLLQRRPIKQACSVKIAALKERPTESLLRVPPPAHICTGTGLTPPTSAHRQVEMGLKRE